MTEDQLKELEDLLAKATPGEWEREGRDEEDWIAGRRQNAEMGNIVCSQPEMSLSAKRWEANAALIVAISIEAAERGDLDLSDASIALTEDCGDKAREALASTGEKVS
jgi:predicted NUDIX family NTP pyrophosphohydrolase